MPLIPSGRLRWLCRRGTKELDALYGWWLRERYDKADTALQQAFAELLQEQDPDLWDWTIGRAVPPRRDWSVIVDDIRAHHQL